VKRKVRKALEIDEVVLEKLIITQSIKRFPAFYGN
jgi:hypothetical protein